MHRAVLLSRLAAEAKISMGVAQIIMFWPYCGGRLGHFTPAAAAVLAARRQIVIIDSAIDIICRNERNHGSPDGTVMVLSAHGSCWQLHHRNKI